MSMAMFPDVRLIACDLDGTLLLNGAQSLRPDTCGLIQRLKNLGMLFVAASGRQYTNLLRLFHPIKDQIGYICENGCLCFYHGTLVHKETMDRALGQEIMREIMSSEGAEILLSGEKVSYLQPKDMQYFYHMRDVVKNDVMLVPDIFPTEEDYFKISIYEKGGLRDAAYWQNRFGDRCTVVTGGNEWLDIMPKGVNKASGLEKMLRVLRIDADDCMAIGDNDNDREMLQMAGFPTAVSSAKPSIRAMARYETDTVEHLFEALLTEYEKEK